MRTIPSPSSFPTLLSQNKKSRHNRRRMIRLTDRSKQRRRGACPRNRFVCRNREYCRVCADGKTDTSDGQTRESVSSPLSRCHAPPIPFIPPARKTDGGAPAATGSDSPIIQKSLAKSHWNRLVGKYCTSFPCANKVSFVFATGRSRLHCTHTVPIRTLLHSSRDNPSADKRMRDTHQEFSHIFTRLPPNAFYLPAHAYSTFLGTTFLHPFLSPSPLALYIHPPIRLSQPQFIFLLLGGMGGGSDNPPFPAGFSRIQYV